MAGLLHVRLVSADRVVHEGDATSLVAPAWDGKVGILPGHAPMITLLGAGMLGLDRPGRERLEVYVAGGVLKVEADQVTVLTEYSAPEAPANGPPAGVVPDVDSLLEEED